MVIGDREWDEVLTWALIPKTIRKKGVYQLVQGVFVGYFDNLKAYKIWIPRTHTILKAQDTIFDESKHIERVNIHTTDEDELPDLWINESLTTITTLQPTNPNTDQTNDHLSSQQNSSEPKQEPKEPKEPDSTDRSEREVSRELTEESNDTYEEPPHAPLDFERGPWLNPANQAYGQGKRHQALLAGISNMAQGRTDIEETEVALVVLAEDKPTNY